MTREIRLVALGGLGEIGKNLMLLESGSDIIAIVRAPFRRTIPGVDT